MLINDNGGRRGVGIIAPAAQAIMSVVKNALFPFVLKLEILYTGELSITSNSTLYITKANEKKS